MAKIAKSEGVRVEIEVNGKLSGFAPLSTTSRRLTSSRKTSRHCRNGKNAEIRNELLKLNGIHEVRRKLADGTVRVHDYVWRGVRKMESAPKRRHSWLSCLSIGARDV